MKRKSIQSSYHLTDEEKREMLEEIEVFYKNEREESIGIIGCNQVLDFFLETLGKRIYNKALDDAQVWYKRASENLEADFFSLYQSE